MDANQPQPRILNENTLLLRYPFEKYIPISSPFGVERTLEINGEKVTRKHNGIDFSCPKWTRILSVANGRIHMVGLENPNNENVGYGYRVIQEAEIDGKKFFIWYGHLSWATVQINEPVKPGDPVAMSGNSGGVVRTPPGMGYHLHISARASNTGKFYDMEFFDTPKEV